MDNVVFVPETPLKLLPNCSPDKNNTSKSLTEGDLTLVKEPVPGLIRTGQSSHFSENTSSVTSFRQSHSSPMARKSDSDELGHLHSSSMSLSSPSFVEMFSSPERSPLPENLDDLGEYNNSPNKAQTFSIQNSHDSPSSSPNKYTDDERNIENCLNACISVIESPESRTTSSSTYSTKIGDDVATADEDNIKETTQLSTFLDKGDSKRVGQASVMEPCRKRNKLPNKIEDDSLLDIFATSISDSKTVQSPVYISNQVDSCSSIDISTLSPKSILSSPALYSPKSKEEGVGIRNSEAELKDDYDEENLCVHSADTAHRVEQSLVFNAENEDMSGEMYLIEENSRCHEEKIRTLGKDVSETTKRQPCTLTTNQINSWLDKCSLQSKDETYFDQNDRRSQGNKKTDEVIENTKSKTFSAQSEATSSVNVQSDKQKDCSNGQFMTPRQVNKITTKQTRDLASKADNWLNDSSIKDVNSSNREDQDKEEENISYNNDDDDGYIDCFDDGGFNCDIEEYFSYDAYSAIEQDNVVPADEEQGTSSLMNAKEETTNNRQSIRGEPKEEIKKQENDIQRIENKKDKTIKDTKKRNNAAGGKTGKSKNEFASKQAKTNDIVQKEFKLRDPRTPMLDYSNMATPELKVRLCGLRTYVICVLLKF